MPALFLLHTSLLIASIGGVYFWLSLPQLAPYTLQLVAVLILIFAATHWGRNRLRAKARRRNTVPLDLSLLTSAILLLVTETGALSSPIFFLLYFLLFGVAMLYEIEATLVLTAGLLVYFLLLNPESLTSAASLGELLALVMITPIALFTGHEYEKLVKLESRTTRETTDTLSFLSKNLRTTLTSALDRLTLIIPRVGVSELQKNLTLLYQDLRALNRSATDLEHELDQKVS